MDPQEVTNLSKALGRSLAAHRKAAGYTQTDFAPMVRYGRSTIANVETGRQTVPKRFWDEADRILNADGKLLTAHSQLQTHVQTTQRAHAFRSAPSQGLDESWAALLDSENDRAEDLSHLINVVLSPASQKLTDMMNLGKLKAAVADARRQYQSCRYREALRLLPAILLQLRSAKDDTKLSRPASILSVDAYQIVAGVMLKFSENAIATIAAERSMAAAEANGDPILIISSARSITHTLMRTGYPDIAAKFASSQAARFDTASSDCAHLSVQGALLLRGAVAAANSGNRPATTDLLNAAHDASSHLGGEDNLRGTGFNPINIDLHRVHIARVLGDAGQAIKLAQDINIKAIKLTERRASFIIDVAAAFVQWGKYDRALDTLCYAEAAAPQEVRVRKNVHDLLMTVQHTGSRSARSRAEELSQRLARP